MWRGQEGYFFSSDFKLSIRWRPMKQGFILLQETEQKKHVSDEWA